MHTGDTKCPRVDRLVRSTNLIHFLSFLAFFFLIYGKVVVYRLLKHDKHAVPYPGLVMASRLLECILIVKGLSAAMFQFSFVAGEMAARTYVPDCNNERQG